MTLEICPGAIILETGFQGAFEMDAVTTPTMQIVAFPAGAVIFREGEIGDCAYILETGRVEISRQQGEESRVLAILESGDLLGEMALIDHSTRTATATTQDDCLLAVITPEQFHQRLDSADPVVETLLQVVLQRYRTSISRAWGGAEAIPPTPPVKRPVSSVKRFSYHEAIDKMRLENELRHAITGRKLQTFFQPLAHLPTGRWAGFEALVRWPHPTLGMISPDRFIGLAEETQLISPLGLLVLEEAARELLSFQALWRARLGEEASLFVAVNVSAKQLEEENFIENINAVIGRLGISPKTLKLEITESLITDSQRVKTWVASCHKAGYSIALDDFGTGFSTFEQLMTLDIDTLKIDQAFVREMIGNPRAMAMVNGMLTLAQGLGLKTVAEGVETLEQAQSLRALGCDYAQGYYISRPQGAEGIRAAIQRGEGENLIMAGSLPR
ncbi:MAG: EAL domain-containing protein [Pseudomonadota bacterium]